MSSMAVDAFTAIIMANYTVGEIYQLDLTAQLMEAKKRLQDKNWDDFSKHVDNLPAEDDPEDGA